MRKFRAGMWLIVGAIVVMGLAAVPSHAAVIFSDNFDGENGGIGALNYAGFANWTVPVGTVDLIPIAGGGFNFYPGNGLYVDLNGSTGVSGKMTSTALSLAPGNYELSFSLGGSTRGDTNSVIVSMTNGVMVPNTFLNFPSNFPFSAFTLPFTVLSETSAKIVFDASAFDPDNMGLILDQVRLISVSTVPEPGAMLLLGSGLVGLMVYGRKRFRK